MKKPPAPFLVDAIRLSNRRIEGAPAGFRELVVSIESGGVEYEIIMAMQSSPGIDDLITADGIRDYINAGCPRRRLPK